MYHIFFDCITIGNKVVPALTYANNLIVIAVSEEQHAKNSVK